MVDFNSLVGGTREDDVFDLEKLFASLDVKGTHTELRPAQREALAELTRRSAERDMVLKISTGAGKTSIGLLYLLGHMKRLRAPAVYLCPTVQLVEQVVEEAGRLGIPAHAYPAREPHPNPAGMRGDAVLVCTYEKLFNAKSTFTRSDVNLFPGALALDDAHAGAEIVRKQFTLRLQGAAYTALLEIVAPPCRSYHQTRWADIEKDDPLALLEVPHWIWADHCDRIRAALHRFADTDEFKFVWPYLETILPLCRCVVGSGSAEIAPEVLPTQFVRPFVQAKHRLFMSATLADDSLLTRELGATAEAAINPVLPPSDRGLGERMILAPSLVDPELDRSFVMHLTAELAKSYNVVVLTSSELRAREWEVVGARYFAGDTFSDGVRRLRDSSSGLRFAVFAQRYDGVDLPDDACRVLVVDGTPYGESLIDRSDASMVFAPGGLRNRTVFRIEQGMGRAVRSHADYAVVLLVGDGLTTYVGRHDVLKAMTEDTRAQIELSIELAELVRKPKAEKPDNAVRHVIEQCLRRDAGWKDFYNKRIRSLGKRTPQIDTGKIELASEEREAHVLAMNNGFVDAKARLEKAIHAAKLENEELGMHLQRLARVAYLSDPAEAIKIQQGARDRCHTVSLPPAAPRRPALPGGKTAAEKLCIWFKRFASPNAAVIESKRIADSLDLNANHRAVEEAVKRLGEALGADSSRPEIDFNEGPDNLWFWGSSALVIGKRPVRTVLTARTSYFSPQRFHAIRSKAAFAACRSNRSGSKSSPAHLRNSRTSLLLGALAS